MQQLDLFESVARAYVAAAGDSLSNDELYTRVAQIAGVDRAEMEAQSPIGQKGTPRSVMKRKIRWHQQTLKAMGVLEHVPGKRGVWRIAEHAGGDLHRAQPGVKVVAFSTDLGVAIWGACRDVFHNFAEPIHLCVTSPPYPLARPRAYGNPKESEYVDFLCSALEPIVRALVPGGSICLNLSNDIFLPGLPARSLYRERLMLALHDRLGMYKMDDLVWHNPSKPPGPTYWASITRSQLNAAYEPVLWLTNDPTKVRADNRRVLEPHTDAHLRLLARGGEGRSAEYGDGAYRIRPNSFGQETSGRIPRNVISRSHVCKDTNRYRADAKALGLPIHGAMQPLAIADFLIRYLTKPQDLVVDLFGGTLTTAVGAENNGRRWIACEWILEYLRGGMHRFRERAGFQASSAFSAIPAGGLQ